jgi:tRNA(Ile)-lysidine synthase
MHFLRGAGLSGLKGMSAVTLLPEFDPGICVIRPLLRTWRKEIEAYCRTHNLETVEDLSNADQTYFRNRLRHSLIPEMETYNPGFKQALLRSAESLGGDHQLVSDVLDGFWEDSLLQVEAGFLAFKLATLQAASPAMLRNLFRRTAIHLNSDLRDVNFGSVERLVRYVKEGVFASREIDFTDGNHAFVEGDRFYVARRSENIPHPDWPHINQPEHLVMGQPMQLGADWQLLVNESSGIKDIETITANADPFQAWLDADLVHSGLQIRNRLDGDRFQPLGMPQGSIKLSDFFINEKLPARARTHWPMVCQKNEILWIPGYRLAHLYRITAATSRFLHFELRNTKN